MIDQSASEQARRPWTVKGRVFCIVLFLQLAGSMTIHDGEHDHAGRAGPVSKAMETERLPLNETPAPLSQASVRLSSRALGEAHDQRPSQGRG